MLKLVSLLLTVMVTSALFSNLSCFAAAVQGHPGNESTSLEDVYSRSISVRQAPFLPNGGKCASETSSGVYTCYDDAFFCAINTTNGKPNVGCVNASMCPAAVSGFDMVCDSTSPLCCCKASSDRSLPCNDLWNEKYDTVHKQACRFQELKNLSVCQTPTWTTPKPIFTCVTQEPNGTREVKDCTDSDKFLCGIDKQSGSAVGCVPRTDCPADTYANAGSVLCKDSQGTGARYCCCRPDEGKVTRCNDIFNEKDNTAWRKACKRSDLKKLPLICGKSWTTTPRPPPTPPHPPPPVVTANNMTRHCLDHCIKNAPPGNPGPFELRCGDLLPDQPTWNCPLSHCPLGCDRYCPDGTNLKCPKLREPSEGNATDKVTQPSAEPPFLGEEDKEQLPLAVIIGVVAVILILGVGASCLWCRKWRHVQPQQASVMNTSPYPGPGGGAPRSASTVSSSPSGNQSSSSSAQMAPKARQAQQVQFAGRQQGNPIPRKI